MGLLERGHKGQQDSWLATLDPSHVRGRTVPIYQLLGQNDRGGHFQLWHTQAEEAAQDIMALLDLRGRLFGAGFLHGQ